MDRNNYLPILLADFEEWYKNSLHSENEGYYLNILTKENIASMSKIEFIDFFLNFFIDGGKIQTGGDRQKNLFANKTLEKNYDKFRNYVLRPFNNDFNLDDWLFNGNIEYFRGGIATIYLNRINKNKYSILNKKTMNSLQALGYNVSTSFSRKNYYMVHNIQTGLMNEYSNLVNYYKIDAINEFIIGAPKYINELNNLKSADELISIDDDICKNIKIETNKLSKKELKDKILSNQKNGLKYVNNNGKIIKRDQYLINLIKEYRGFSCQFCSKTLLTKNDDYYIEACHITPKGKNGNDTLDNIIVLCPYCHKLLDKAHREEIERTKNIYRVKLNNIIYEASLG